MKNSKTLTADILNQTSEIRERYPELSRDLTETPEPMVDYSDPKINRQELEDYYHSISILISNAKESSVGDIGTIPSHPRPDARRKLNTQLMQIDLLQAIADIKEEGNWVAGNRNSKTLVKSGDVSIVVMALPQHYEIKMHKSEGPIILQVMEGGIQFITEEDTIELKMGGLVTLHANLLHKAIANEQSILLLTMITSTENQPPKKDDESEKDLEEKEIVEESANLNFPDFPTYPPDDDVYKEPLEKESEN